MLPPTDYSDKDWALICSIPQLIGLLMSTAAYSGVEGTIDELKSSVETIASGKLVFPDNSLISAILPSVDSQDKMIKKLEDQQKDIIKKKYIKELFDLEIFQNNVIEKLETVLYVISKKEKAYIVSEFKKWILSIAEQVAISAIEDTYFGEKTDPFSQKEKVLFNKINKILTKI